MYVPAPPPPPSKEVVELSEFLNRVIEAYQHDHPELTAGEIRQALQLATPSRGRLAAAAAATAVIGLLVFLLAGLRYSKVGGDIPWCGVIVGVAALAITLGAVAVVRTRK